jgi:hypothetical protein
VTSSADDDNDDEDDDDNKKELRGNNLDHRLTLSHRLKSSSRAKTGLVVVVVVRLVWLFLLPCYEDVG